MLLIQCPYCGPRPELEFAYAGQAHIARPADPVGRRRRTMGASSCTCATTPGASTPSAGATCAAARASSTRCATPPPTTSWRPTAPVSRCLRPAEAEAVSGRRIEHGGRIDRSRAVRFTFDGKAYSGFAGDTLASALLANGVHLFGRSFKYHRPRGVIAAGSEEPNALVTVIRDAGALHAEPARDAGRAVRRPRRREPEPLAEPRLRRAGRQRPAVAAAPGGVLLQDVHVAAAPRGTSCTSRSSAARPASASRPRCRTRTATRSASRIATCWWSAPVPPALLQRWRRPPAARA